MPGSAVAITALTALADYARSGDLLIDTICDRMGVDVADRDIDHMRAVLAGAAHTLTSHITMREIDDARRITEERAWAEHEGEAIE